MHQDSGRRWFTESDPKNNVKLTFPCMDEQIVDAKEIPAPMPATLKRVDMASPLANRSLRFPSLANEEYIGNLVALAATTAIPCQQKCSKLSNKLDLRPSTSPTVGKERCHEISSSSYSFRSVIMSCSLSYIGIRKERELEVL